MLNQQIKKAMEFAQKAHQSQMYDQYPYFKHLEDVYKTLISFGYEDNLNILISSFLHDILEDTATSYSDLKKEFGEDVAEIVYCMTDELGRNRKEKKSKTYPKIRSNPDSIIVKLADRICNIEHSIKEVKDYEKTKGFLEMYQKEYKLFKWNLYVEGHAYQLWKHLDKLMKAQ